MHEQSLEINPETEYLKPAIMTMRFEASESVPRLKPSDDSIRFHPSNWPGFVPWWTAKDNVLTTAHHPSDTNNLLHLISKMACAFTTSFLKRLIVY
ncbi:MAG: hypothetical protein DRI57_12340 [Deltaproteobacteria bacterium]|nr:MAG: hypothetical protein DRI57_12340 [Deltaproteobacteria bacterium]